MDLPAPDLHRKINKYIKQKWQDDWDDQQNNKLKEVQQSIGTNHENRNSRKEEVLLSRLRIGHTRLTHSHKMKGEEAPVCARCQAPLTVKHILIECGQCPVRNQFHQCTTMKELFETCKPETILAYIKALGYIDQL